MNKYIVTVEIDSDGEEWSYPFEADSFSHAEEQAIDYLAGLPETIIRIEMVREAGE